MRSERTCIYCTRDDAAFNTEHVIPQAFGLFEQNLTLDCVCVDCNSHFGKTIDLTLGRDSVEALLRFFHGTKPASEARELRRRRLTVTLDADPDWSGCWVDLLDEDGEIVVTLVPQVRFGLCGGGSVFVTDRVLTDETKPLPDAIDPKQIMLISNSPDTDERLIALLARRGIAFEKGSESRPPANRGMAPLDIRMRFDAIILRSVAKIAFNYVARVAGAAFVLNEAFDTTRAYVRHGTRPPYPVVTLRGEPILAAPGSAQGHLLTVDWASDPDAVVGQVSLFNSLTYRVSLARRYGGVWLPVRSGHYFDLETRRISPLVVPRRRP